MALKLIRIILLPLLIMSHALKVCDSLYKTTSFRVYFNKTGITLDRPQCKEPRKVFGAESCLQPVLKPKAETGWPVGLIDRLSKSEKLFFFVKGFVYLLTDGDLISVSFHAF